MTRLLRPARVIWVFVAIISMVAVIASTTLRYQQLAEITPDAALITGQLRPLEAQALENIGLSISFYAVYITVLEVIASLAFLFIGVLIFWQRSDEWMPLLFSLTLVSFGISSSPLTTALELNHPMWAMLLTALRSLALISMILSFLLFPDGRFVPSWAKWLASVWTAYIILSLLIPPLRFTASVIWEDEIQAITFIWALVWLLIVAVVQAYRYQYRSNPAQRQQTKWVVFGLVVGIISSVTASVIAFLTPYLSESMSIILIIRCCPFAENIMTFLNYRPTEYRHS